jgi:hypothetical protein
MDLFPMAVFVAVVGKGLSMDLLAVVASRGLPTPGSKGPCPVCDVGQLLPVEGNVSRCDHCDLFIVERRDPERRRELLWRRCVCGMYMRYGSDRIVDREPFFDESETHGWLARSLRWLVAVLFTAWETRQFECHRCGRRVEFMDTPGAGVSWDL